MSKETNIEYLKYAVEDFINETDLNVKLATMIPVESYELGGDEIDLEGVELDPNKVYSTHMFSAIPNGMLEEEADIADLVGIGVIEEQPSEEGQLYFTVVSF